VKRPTVARLDPFVPELNPSKTESRVQRRTPVLVVRAVIGVGIDDQLRVRDVLLHDEGVDRGMFTSLLPFTTSVGCLIVFR